MSHDPVNNPSHYTSHPSGIEAIQVTEHMNFCIGNAIKYLWRAGLKTEEGIDARAKQIQDMEKAVWYVKREIERISSNEQRVSEGVLEPTPAQSDDEVHRTHESSDDVVEELDFTKCKQCGCFSECTKNSFCKRCVTK